MGLPRLQEFLPPHDEQPAKLPISEELAAQLDQREAKTVDVEQKAAVMRAGLERYISVLRENLQYLSEDDLANAYEQIHTEDKAYRSTLSEMVTLLRQRRAEVAKLKKTAATTKALQLYDRQIRTVQLGLASFEWGKEQTETLRDAILVREAQEFSAQGFWSED